MSECPKYVNCNAPICPLDPDWGLRVMGDSEPVCLFAREHVKEGADERFNANPIYKEIRISVVSLIEELNKLRKERGDAGLPRGLGNLVRGLEAAKGKGSKLDQAERFRKPLPL